MLAIFKTGGKQYSVKAGQILKIEKVLGKKGDSISFNDVLAISDASNHTVGDPLVKGASVEATILEQIRDKKIIVFKKRQRQNYRHTQGHRQYLTVLQIKSIAFGSKKSATPDKNNDNLKKTAIKKKTASPKKTATPKKVAATKKTKVVKKKLVKKKTLKDS